MQYLDIAITECFASADCVYAEVNRHAPIPDGKYCLIMRFRELFTIFNLY